MARGRSRALSLGALLVLVLLLGSGTIFLWRRLPPTSGLLGMGWSGSPFSGPGDLPTAIHSASLAGLTVWVYSNPETRRVTPDSFYLPEVMRWRQTLTDLGARAVRPENADVLVFPYALCLDERLRALLARQLERGKGVVTAGAVGAYGGRCEVRPDTLLTYLLGGTGSLQPLPLPDSGSHYAVVLGETVLGAGVPPGSRIEIRPSSHQLAFHGSGREAFYADFLRHPRPVSGVPYFDGATARSRVDSGRVAALGFALTDLAGSFSEAVTRAMIANAVVWAGGRPMAEIAPWPHDARAAVVFAEDVEYDFDNAARVVSVLRKLGVPGSFYLLGSAAREHLETTQRIAAYGEVGTHTVDHRNLDHRSYDRQLRQLEWSQRDITELIGHPVAGLRPPEERFDLETLKAWQAAGGDYVFAANNVRTAAPELIPIGDDSMVVLARVFDDDYHFLDVEDVRDRSRLVAHFVTDLNDIAQLRGLYMFSTHSHILGRPDLLSALTAFAETVRNDSTVWVATASQVANWWRARSHVRVQPAPDGTTVQVTNDGSEVFPSGVLVVELPDGERQRVALDPIRTGGTVVVPIPETPRAEEEKDRP